MLNSATKIIYILTLVLSEKKFLNEAKNHNPPFKLVGCRPYLTTCTIRGIHQISNEQVLI